MTDAEGKDWQERQRLHDRTRDDLLKRQLSNGENADRAILTVSAAALGFSLAFIKDIVPLTEAECLFFLYSSWVCFVLATICTLVSFFTSQHAIEVQLERAHRYYLMREDAAFDGQSRSAALTNWLNKAGAVFFVAGMLAACVFVAINLGKENRMNKRVPAMDGAPIPTLQKLPTGTVTKGANIPSMQPVQPQSGATIPTMQKPAEPPPSSGNSNGK